MNRSGWGAVARSNYSGLRYREPIYPTIRALVLSYFESYFNLRRQKSLRRHSRPRSLARFDRIDWMTAEQDLWEIPRWLETIRHDPLLSPRTLARLGSVDRRMFEAGRSDGRNKEESRIRGSRGQGPESLHVIHDSC